MDIWTEILSRNEEHIRQTFLSLSQTEKITVRADLIKMTTEPDWHPQQIQSAQIALDAVKDIP